MSATSSSAACSATATAVRVLDSLLFDHGSALAGVFEDPGFSFVRGDLRDAADRRCRARGRHRRRPACRSRRRSRSAASTRSSPARSTSGRKRLFDIARRAGAIDRFVFTSTCSQLRAARQRRPRDRGVRARAGLALRRDQGRLRAVRARPQRDEWDCCPTLAADRHRLWALAADALRPDDLRVHANARGRRGARSSTTPIPGGPTATSTTSRAAIRTVLAADEDTVAGEVFNVGHSDENYTKRMVVDAVQEHLGGAGKVTFKEGGRRPPQLPGELRQDPRGARLRAAAPRARDGRGTG